MEKVLLMSSTNIVAAAPRALNFVFAQVFTYNGADVATHNKWTIPLGRTEADEGKEFEYYMIYREEFIEATEKMQEGPCPMDMNRGTSLREQAMSDAKSVDWNSIHANGVVAEESFRDTSNDDLSSIITFNGQLLYASITSIRKRPSLDPLQDCWSTLA